MSTPDDPRQYLQDKMSKLFCFLFQIACNVIIKNYVCPYYDNYAIRL
uniref:Uncharacterized protein n=1 Tax=Arundo donax TaxID=35708 RepID=A0A0A9B3Y5_ARUDO